MREVTGIDATLGKRQGKREEMDEAERSSRWGGGRCRKLPMPRHGSVSIDLPFWCETMDHEPFSVVLEEVKIFFPLLLLCLHPALLNHRILLPV